MIRGSIRLNPLQCVPIHRLCRTGIIAGLLVTAAIPASRANPPPIPPLTTPASEHHYAGKVVWFQLVTPDLAAAKTFYAGVFGWTFHDSQLGDTAFAEADLGSQPVAGLFQRPVKPDEHRQPAWVGFISTSDADTAARTAREHGAKILFEPHDIPNLGRDAILQDPQGAIFAILTSSSGDPPDILADPGAWVWSSLITTDPETGAAFYQTMFGYDVYDLPAEKGAGHFLLASGGYARASVNSLPADGANVHPHWLNFVRVEDAVATAAKAVALGGRVLVEPHLDRHGGKVAVVADPLGAPFGLLEWPENESRKVTP